jgi:hypothetical protein
MYLYNLLPNPETFTCEFAVLRDARNVIKMGRFRVWDLPPAQSCPVLDRHFRYAGIRGFLVSERRDS